MIKSFIKLEFWGVFFGGGELQRFNILVRKFIVACYHMVFVKKNKHTPVGILGTYRFINLKINKPVTPTISNLKINVHLYSESMLHFYYNVLKLDLCFTRTWCTHKSS